MILTKVKNEVGATAIEYGLLASLIAVSAIGGMSAVGMNLSNTFCTISQHLGGSGTCSGGGSSGPSGNGGNGGTTDLDSLTGTAYFNALNSSLLDKFDANYLDSTLGGKNSIEKDQGLNSLDNPKNVLAEMNDYNKRNEGDQITHVFGLYDPTTYKPVTDWAAASQILQNNRGLVGKDNTSDFSSLEFTTQSGKVFTVDSYGSGMDGINEKNIK